MYSSRVQNMLDQHDISPGDRITVEKGGTSYEGVLMPRSRQGDADTIVLKLDNGYNTGIRYTDDVDVAVVEHRETAVEKDVDIPDRREALPDITILHTGGTIASRVSYAEGGVKPAFDPEDLLEMYPELFARANVESEVIAQMLSEDMEPVHWVQIAEAVAEHRDADGIIIGHGTDTMHYTGAALSLMLENIDIPVVLVGAQRSSDRPSSDAAMNLLSAARFIQEGVPGVYICMHASVNDTTAAIHHGARARKMHTSRRDAFRSIDTAPVATVDHRSGEVTMHRDVSSPTEEFALRTALETDVALVKTGPGFDPAQLAAHADRDGLIIEGTGLGHLPVNAFDEHTQHHAEVLETLEDMTGDTVVAMASQCINGRVNMNVYDAGVKIQHAGVISAESMTPETAYVKLMWALGQADDREAAAQLFQQDVVGELVDREEYHGDRA